MQDYSLYAWLAESANLQVLSSWVTAVATVVLVIVTAVLAYETRVLSRATAQAHVTVTLEPNQWAAHHVDIIVENSGNAAAYAVRISFDPPLPSRDDLQNHRKTLGVPLTNISVLRPGQAMQSNLCEFSAVSKKAFAVTVNWKRHPRARREEELSYQLSMTDYRDVSYLGARSPMTQIADQIKKIQEDWRQVARGNRRLEINSHTQGDREEERREREEWFNNQRIKAAESRSLKDSDGAGDTDNSRGSS